jgi:hypothetical protein
MRRWTVSWVASVKVYVLTYTDTEHGVQADIGSVPLTYNSRYLESNNYLRVFSSSPSYLNFNRSLLPCLHRRIKLLLPLESSQTGSDIPL